MGDFECYYSNILTRYLYFRSCITSGHSILTALVRTEKHIKTLAVLALHQETQHQAVGSERTVVLENTNRLTNQQKSVELNVFFSESLDALLVKFTVSLWIKASDKGLHCKVNDNGADPIGRQHGATVHQGL